MLGYVWVKGMNMLCPSGDLCFGRGFSWGKEEEKMKEWKMFSKHGYWAGSMAH